ncbi:TlpA family protein disulfide reductase [Pseudobdellovibrio sp. HCB154]|uniref:TlpA family protein disulfide reductase n=1 Tax=Pseudobdellovibrio sp. HCB154 TaxID=3386277 RepID=UPI003916DBEE
MTFKSVAKALNIVLTVVVLVLLAAKIPGIIDNFKTEGSAAPDFSVLTNSGLEFNTKDLHARKVLVFWATWCPPCEMELSRINELVKEKRIPAEAILAISMQEDKALVDKVVTERGYQFPIGYDLDGQVSQLFKIQGTPTLVFLNGDKTIRWLSTGLSPLLKLRLNIFLD